MAGDGSKADVCLCERGQKEPAIKLFEMTYDLLKQKGWPRTKSALDHMGEIMRAAGLVGVKPRALEFAKDLERDYSSRKDTPPAMLGRAKFMVGYTLFTSQQRDEAIRYLRDSLKNYLLADPNNWHSIKPKIFLGEALLYASQFDEAEKRSWKFIRMHLLVAILRLNGTTLSGKGGRPARTTL